MKNAANVSSWWQQRLVVIGIALGGLLLILTLITMNIAKKENHLTTGQPVLLELAPVDPRGFMQGDYMALSYALEQDIFNALTPKLDKTMPETSESISNGEFGGNIENNDSVEDSEDSNEIEDIENIENSDSDFHIYEPSQGYVIVETDKHNVGHFVRLADHNSNVNLDSRDKLAANELAIFYRIRNNSVYIATNAFFFQEGHAESFEAAKYGLFRINKKGEPLLTQMIDDKFAIIIGKNRTDINATNDSLLDENF